MIHPHRAQVGLFWTVADSVCAMLLHGFVQLLHVGRMKQAVCWLHLRAASTVLACMVTSTAVWHMHNEASAAFWA